MTHITAPRKSRAALALAALLVLTWSGGGLGLALAGSGQTGAAVTAEVKRVYDGDTLIVDVPGWPDIIGKAIGVRVAGIDTPEMRDTDPTRREAAKRAKAAVEAMAPPGRAIELRNVARDKYFRLLADVAVDGRDIAAELLERGLARPYDGGHKEPW